MPREKKDNLLGISGSKSSFVIEQKNEIYQNIDLLGDFKTTYWTSTEAEYNTGAWRQNLYNSAQNVSKKYEPFSVRPVRVF